MASSSATLYETARRHVEAQIKAQKDVRHRRLITKRLEFVNQGVKAYQAKKPAEAAVFYQSFVKLMEEHKGAQEGSLSPALFNPNEELGDLLLLSGVYWDLVKLFDRTQTPEKVALFQHYMEKFILFSKGTNYQPLVAEGLRRYISGDKPVHLKNFKAAYKLLGDGKCFVATSLLDVIDEGTLPALHRFRDGTLSRSAGGRAFIRGYYRIGPGLASGVERLPEPMRQALGRGVGWIARRLDSF